MQKLRGSAVAYVALLTAVLVCHAKEVEDQVTYDQRQHGDLNVHVHVQDVGILALLDEALFGGIGQYDYSYDYQDVQDPAQEPKPSAKPPTLVTDAPTEAASPTTTTDPTNISTTSTTDPTNIRTTNSTNTTVETECNNKTTTSCPKSPSSNKEISQTGDKQQAGPFVAMFLSQQGSGRRRCNPGYVRDSRGRCRRHRRPSYYTMPLNLPFGIKLAPRP